MPTVVFPPLRTVSCSYISGTCCRHSTCFPVSLLPTAFVKPLLSHTVGIFHRFPLYHSPFIFAPVVLGRQTVATVRILGGEFSPVRLSCLYAVCSDRCSVQVITWCAYLLIKVAKVSALKERFLWGMGKLNRALAIPPRL